MNAVTFRIRFAVLWCNEPGPPFLNNGVDASLQQGEEAGAGIGMVSSRDALSRISVPIQMLVGEKDE